MSVLLAIAAYVHLDTHSNVIFRMKSLLIFVLCKSFLKIKEAVVILKIEDLFNSSVLLNSVLTLAVSTFYPTHHQIIYEFRLSFLSETLWLKPANQRSQKQRGSHW